ncbi:TonB-dependent receptor, partial [uncultured Nevskia sp.]|uniref:TonB-dependent receptor n=1 Tax=uncultured Nevskia sp. TaxID=228950 RepID=UPI0025F02522
MAGFPAGFNQRSNTIRLFLRLIFGVEVWERNLESRRERFDGHLGRIIGERPVPASSYLSAGAFLQDTWDLVPERLSLTFGGRYDLIRVENNEVWNP